MEWWTPVPWVLAAVGLGVAAFALRRSRYAAARLTHISSVGIQGGAEAEEVWHLFVEVLCTGADIFDARLFLECYYRPARHRTTWPDVLALEFYPTPVLPNPIKNGQAVRFELTDDHLKRALELNAGYFCLPSRLPRRRTRLALYAGGDRVVATTSSPAFRRALETFAARSAPSLRTGNRASGWSHQYVQPPVGHGKRNA